MAYQESLKRISLDADSTIGFYTGAPGMPGSTSPNSGKQFCFVKVTGAHQAGLATGAASEPTVGVLQNKPQNVGDASSVAISGVSMVVAGAAVTAAELVTSDSQGRAIAAGSGTVYGVAIDAAAAAGDLVPVLIKVN